MNHPDSVSDLRLADRLALSALADGEASDREATRVLARWAQDPALQRDWHDWQRIGDVLRSDDLARPAACDEDFLSRLRERLAQEPAPPALEAATSARHRAVEAPAPGSIPGWRMPLALAAGVAAVAVGVSLLQVPRAPDAVAVARASAPAKTVPPRSHAPPPLAFPGAVGGPAPSSLASTPGQLADGVVLRDPRLDSVLRAHRGPSGAAGAQGPTASGAPPGRVETVGLDR